MNKSLILIQFVLLFFLILSHNYSSGQQPECDENDFVSALVALLHQFGVGYPILIGERSVVKINLSLMIRMKSEWPTTQLDKDWDRSTVQFARDNGIPLDADGRLDMEKIVRKEMVTEMADKFGILECTIRPISAGRNEKLESDSSKINSSRSINNNYRKSRINISDQESAAATQFESSSKTETSGSKNYEKEISRKYGRRATRKFNEQSSDHSDRQQLETFNRKRTSRRGETPTKHYGNKASASGSKSSKYFTAGDEQQSSDAESFSAFYQRQKPAHQTSRRKFGNKTPKKYGNKTPKYGNKRTATNSSESSSESDQNAVEEIEKKHSKLNRLIIQRKTPKHDSNRTSSESSDQSDQEIEEFYWKTQRKKAGKTTKYPNNVHQEKAGQRKASKKYSPGTEENSSSSATSSDSSVERKRAYSLPKKHGKNIPKKKKEAAAILPDPPMIGSYETTGTYVPPFMPNSVVDSSSIPAINCEKSEHLNDFVRILYSFRLENSKVLRKTGPNQLVFNLSHLLKDDSEWDAIERPLDDVQLGLAQGNFFPTKMGKRGRVTLDMVDFITNAHVRLVAMKTPQIRCTIVDERRQESSLVNETSSNRRPNSEEKFNKRGSGSSKSDKDPKFAKSSTRNSAKNSGTDQQNQKSYSNRSSMKETKVESNTNQKPNSKMKPTTSDGSSSSSTELDETPKASSKHIETDQSLKSTKLLSTNTTLTVDDHSESKSGGEEDEFIIPLIDCKCPKSLYRVDNMAEFVRIWDNLIEFVRIWYSFGTKHRYLKVLKKNEQIGINLYRFLNDESTWDELEVPLNRAQKRLAKRAQFELRRNKRGQYTLNIAEIVYKFAQITLHVEDFVCHVSAPKEERLGVADGKSKNGSTKSDHLSMVEFLDSVPINCEGNLPLLNAFVKIWLSMNVAHKCIGKMGDELVIIELYELVFGDQERWDKLEKVLDTAQINFANLNLIPLTIRADVGKVLDMAKIVKNKNVIELALKTNKISCRIGNIPVLDSAQHSRTNKECPEELKENKKQILEHDKNGNKNAENMSPMPPKKSKLFTESLDCQIAHDLMKNWWKSKEKNRMKKIEIFIVQNFFNENSKGQKMLKGMETTKNYEKFIGIIERFQKIFAEKTEQSFGRKMGENFEKFMTLMEELINKTCKKEIMAVEEKQRKFASENQISIFWEDDYLTSTKSGENVDDEKTSKKPLQKIAIQLIQQLKKLREKFDASLKKGRGFVALLEDIYFECSSPNLRSKISKILEILKWNGLRDVFLSLRQRKSAMVNAWRRVNEFRNCGLMDDLVQRAGEAFEAVDKFLDALKLIEIGENLKEEFEKLDGDGETELNQEVVQSTNNPEWELAEFTNYEMNQLFNRQTSLVIVSLNAVEEAKIMLSAMRKAVSENKHEIQGGVWDQSQNRKFELPKAIYDYVKEKNVNGATGRLLAFLDELFRVNQFDSIKKFVDQIDVYRDDPREEVHELWRKFTQGIDWVQRLNYGRKLVQFVLYLHRLVPKYSEMNALKETTKMEQSVHHQPLVTGKEPVNEVHRHAKEKGTAAGTSGLKGFKNLELETIYRKIKQQMFDQFQVWWKKVPEQKEPLYEFYKQLDDISTRYVLSIVDAFFDGIPIENFRNEYSLGIKDFKIAKERGRAEAESSENDLYSIPSVAVYKSELPDKLSDHVILESKTFLDHFFDQNVFEKNSGRFNLHNFLTKFDEKSSKNMQITAFITKGLGSVFSWSKRFINELVAVTGNDFDELSPLYFYEVSSKIDSNGKKKKLRKPLPPVLNKNKLATIVKVIKLYEQKFNNKNISQMSDQKILEVHWRVMRQKWEAAAVGRRRATESLSRTSSTAEDKLQMLVINAEVQMNEQERKESLDKIEALVRSKRLLIFAIVLRRKYAKVEAEDAKAATSFGPFDTAYFEALRDIRREVERWVPRRREMKRLYRVCRQLNRAERIEISKLIDAFLNGKSVDKYLQKRQKKSGQSVEGKGAKNDVEVKP